MLATPNPSDRAAGWPTLSGRDLERRIDAAQRSGSEGPPALRPFGLVLLRDARWSHEGYPIVNRRLRERFDRSVVYLPDEQAYVVQIGRFRGMIEIEETGFFVRSVNLDRGEITLSDGSVEPLAVATLRPSSIDGAFLCRIKTNLAHGGLPARFLHGAQAELLSAVEDSDAGPVVRLGRERVPLPPAVVGAEA